jgi:hypothetical protein
MGTRGGGTMKDNRAQFDLQVWMDDNVPYRLTGFGRFTIDIERNETVIRIPLERKGTLPKKADRHVEYYVAQEGGGAFGEGRG